MKLHRDWATPLTIGSFVLLAVTGALMFFHLDRGLNKLAHEWLSWVLVAAVGLHAAVNFPALKRHLTRRTGQVLIGVFVLVLGLSFFSLGKKSEGEPAFAGPVRTLAKAPLSAVAQVAGVPVSELRERLAKAGVQATSDTQTLQDLVGPELRKQLGVLRQVLPAGPAS